MCFLVEPAFDGSRIHKQFMLARGCEWDGISIAVKAQNADAFLSEPPSVNPAILSEYRIQKQGFLRMREATLEIGGTPRREKPALFDVNEVGIPLL
jgi:hypothetical protein